MDTTKLESLAQAIGQDKAMQVAKLTENYDKYVTKFKKNMDALLKSYGYEVQVAIAFNTKQEDTIEDT